MKSFYEGTIHVFELLSLSLSISWQWNLLLVQVFHSNIILVFVYIEEFLIYVTFVFIPLYKCKFSHVFIVSFLSHDM
jgi:hypothetical protein